MNLRGKRVLYLDANKTLYTEGISKAFTRSSALIDFITYDEFHGNRVMRRLNKMVYNKQRQRTIDHMFNKIKGKNYDVILVKAPFLIEHEFFHRLIHYFPAAMKINYNWSSVEKYNFLPYKDYFDKIYSFDFNDCEKYGLNYYPLFYLPEFEKAGLFDHKKYDVAFIGTLFNEGRYEFFQKFIDHISDAGFRHKFYFYSPYKKQTLKVLLKKPSMLRYIGSKFLPLNEVIKIMKKSSSMIDYPMDTQTGLTMRTFETIAAGLLLITTNEKVKREAFYDPEKIKIIKPDLSDLKLDWIKAYEPAWDKSFEKYSVDNWIKKITET